MAFWFLDKLKAAFLSTTKKRKRDAAAEEEHAQDAHALSETNGAVSRRLRFSAPEPQLQALTQQHTPHDYDVQQHAQQMHAPQPQPTPSTFHHQPSATLSRTAHVPPPTSLGLHDRFRTLQLDLNLSRPRHTAHAQLGHSLGHGPSPAGSHAHQQAALCAPQHQHAVPSAATANHGAAAVLPKQLHTDFNQAARPQSRGGVPSLPSTYTTSRPHPVSRAAPGQSLNRYAHIVEQSKQKEQERQAWAAQHQHLQPRPTMMIDLTEDNDADLQASRKAQEEQKALSTHGKSLSDSIRMRLEQLAALRAQDSMEAARLWEHEIKRKQVEALEAKMREHHISRQEIRRRAMPELAQPRVPTAVQQQQQQQQQLQQKQQQKDKEVEEVTLISDDEEPQEDQEEDEQDEEEEDQEGEEEDEDQGWQVPEENTEAELATWHLIFCKGTGQAHLDEQLAYHDQSSIPLTRGKMRCLKDGEWLNDEIINVSMALLQQRDTAARQRCSPFPKCHFFNSFFLNKLYKDAQAYKYANVRRWTLPKRLANVGQASPCLLECDRLIVPVHCGSTHWACAMVDLQHRQLCYFDSLRGGHNGVLDHLAQWVVDEAQDKLGEKGLEQWGDATSWPRIEPQDVPRQNNGSDCGVFAIKFAECAGTGRGFDFSCHHMPRIRRSLAHRVINLRI